MEAKNDKYEDKLYGKIDFLHEKSKQSYKNFLIFSDIISKFINVISDFSKSLHNIKNKKSTIIDDKDTSIYNLMHSFKLNLKSHIDEFRECAFHLLRAIDPMTKNFEEKYTKEKDLYNNYIKVRNIYNNAKLAVEKSKKEYYINVKICEDNTLNLVKLRAYDIHSANGQEEKKMEERNNSLIATAKTYEDRYIKCIEDANTARENEIKKQKELLNYYQIFDKEFYNQINIMIKFIVPMTKKMYSSVLKSLEGLEDFCKKVNIQQDIDIFIKKNKSDTKPEEALKFEPYTPETIFDSNKYGTEKKDIENLDINYNVILILHKNFKDIRKDLNMEEEKEKTRLRFLCSQIFKIGPGVGFKDEEKKELLKFLNERKHIDYFFVTLSKQRTKGRYKRSKKLIKDLSEILLLILQGAEKENNFGDARNSIILSQTFYYEIKKDKDIKKRYLIELIKDYKWFKTLEFWEGITEFMIQSEIKKNEEINKKNNFKEDEEQKKNRLMNISFSQVLSYANNMVEFMVDKDDIFKVVDKFVKKYDIEKTMVEAIYENIKNTPYPVYENIEEDEEELNDSIRRYKTEAVINIPEETTNVNKRKLSSNDKDVSNKINNDKKKDEKENENKINDIKKDNVTKKEEEKKDKNDKDKIEENAKKEDEKEVKDEKDKKEDKNEVKDEKDKKEDKKETDVDKKEEADKKEEKETEKKDNGEEEKNKNDK